jgi:gas vesicle protein
MEGHNLMKRQLLLGAILFSLSGSLLAAESLCQQKEQDIQREIDMSKQHNNQRRVTGLERALTEVRAGCTDEKLKSAQSERIAEQKHKIAERERELKEERQDGDKDKIEKRERKLEEARHELKKLEAEPY